MATIFSAFMDGFTGGGLLVKLRRPGGPTQVFADQESTYPQWQLVSSLLQRKADQARRHETQLADAQSELNTVEQRS